METGKYLAWTLAALLFLASVPAGGASDTDASELVIEAGRLHAMLGKAEILLKLDEADQAAPTSDTVRETDDPFVLLKDAVIRYDRDLSDACQKKAISGPMCNDFLAPWWLAARQRPPSAKLPAMIQGISRHISPFWKEACRISGASADPSLCGIE